MFFRPDPGYPKLARFYQKNEWASNKMLYFLNRHNAALSEIEHGYRKHSALKIEVRKCCFFLKWSPQFIFLNIFLKIDFYKIDGHISHKPEFFENVLQTNNL